MVKSIQSIPGVDKLLNEKAIKELIAEFGQEFVVYCIRRVLSDVRNAITNGETSPENDQILGMVSNFVLSITENSLKPVVNSTGIVIHTNLGRAPLGKDVINQSIDIATGYCNLEFDLKKAKRGQRNCHVVELIKYLTKAEDAIVVNNNAAAIILILNTFAKDKETIISRGELIEIGGSFRIPEIMAAAGSRMKEVGTTNKTKLQDYEQAINEETALLFKAHRSNFEISGFTEEASLQELVKLGQKKNIPFVYDIGSGFLRKPKNLFLPDEPDVREAILQGVDLVCFSCDKLLGGPQAGIICGKKELIQKLAKMPMMRALRIGKLTLATLATACKNYLSDESLKKSTPIFYFLERSNVELKKLANLLLSQFNSLGVEAEIICSKAQCGGGTLPNLKINSYAVVVDAKNKGKKDRNLLIEKLFKQLLLLDKPILGFLKQGKLLFDVFTLFEDDIPYIAEMCAKEINNIN